MTCSHNPLRENQINDEEEEDSGSDEYLCCDSDGYVVRVGGEDEPHGAGCYARHAKAEEERGD